MSAAARIEPSVDSQSPDLADVWAALLLSALSFGVYGWLMWLWGRHGVYEQFNIVFDADPNARVNSLAHGVIPYEEAANFSHPLLPYLLSAPIQWLASALETLGVVANPVDFRRLAALGVAPACSALKMGVAYGTGRAMRAPRTGSLGLALLTGFSLAPAVFGALPEYHPLSALALTAAFFWAAAVLFGVFRDRFAVWLLLAVVIAGLTVTNIFILGLLYAACQGSRGQPWRRIAAETAVLGVVSVGLTVAAASLYYHVSKQAAPMATTVTLATDYIRPAPLQAVLRYPPALAASLMGPVPDVKPNPIGVRFGPENAVDVQFTYDAAPLTPLAWARTLLLLGLVCLGGWMGWRGDRRYRGLAVGAALVVAYNGALHAVWGAEWLAYSLHWHAALVMLLAGWLVRRPSVGSKAILTFGCACALNAGWVIGRMLAILEGAGA